MHEHGQPQLAPCALGEADVIEVRMGQDERAHVGGRPTERAESLVQQRPRRLRHSGVDDRQLPVVLDEVPVCVGILDPVDAGCDVSLEHRDRRSRFEPR